MGLILSGGIITNTTPGPVPVALGGTGASTATGAINNLLPAQTTSSGKLLATDGTNVFWSSAGSGSVASVSVATANGISGTVLDPTWNPEITLTLGNITPASVAATGTVTGSNLSGTNTGDQTTITGNAGSATKFETARTINGVSFDGTANIIINAEDSTARVASSLLGVPYGVATLDSSGVVPSAQLPSYIDDVLEYANLAAFPATGDTGKIYVALDTNKTYRWSGSVYIYITSGAVDSVAGKTGVVTLVAGDVGLGNVSNVAQLANTQTLAITGDVTASATSLNTGTIATTLATVNSTPATAAFHKITTNGKGLVTATTAVAQADITGLLGAGSISNTMLANSAVANLSGTNTGDETLATIKSKLGITTLSGSNTGDQTTITGNAGTATTLQTARAINGVSFNGSADITVTAAAGTLSGATLAAGVTASSLTSVGTLGSTQITSLGVGVAANGTTGDIIATGNVTAYFSDDRLKTRTGYIENALEKVNTLDAFYYTPNELAQSFGFDSAPDVALSAQQVKEIMPQVVPAAPFNNDYLTIRYEKLVPLLVAAIKELTAELDALKAQIKG